MSQQTWVGRAARSIERRLREERTRCLLTKREKLARKKDEIIRKLIRNSVAFAELDRVSDTDR